MDIYNMFARYLKYLCYRTCGSTITLSTRHFAKWMRQVTGREPDSGDLTVIGNVLSCLETVNVVERVSNRNYLADRVKLCTMVHSLTIEELADYLRTLVSLVRDSENMYIIHITKLHYAILSELARTVTTVDELSRRLNVGTVKIREIVDRLAKLGLVKNLDNRLTLTSCGAKILHIVKKLGVKKMDVRKVCPEVQNM